MTAISDFLWFKLEGVCPSAPSIRPAVFWRATYGASPMMESEGIGGPNCVLPTFGRTNSETR